MIFNNSFNDVPDTWILTFDQLFSTLRIRRDATIYDFVDNERLEQLNGHFTWNTTLEHLQIRSNSDNGTTREVDTFTQKVLTETTLFTLQAV